MQSTTRWMIGALALGVGCGGAQIEPPGGDSESQASAESTANPGTTTDPTEPGTVTEVGGTTEGDGTTGTTEVTTVTTREGTTDTGGEACITPEGCFDCTPKKPLEFLNACTDAACAPFANTQKRLPLLEDDGTLPPLP